MTTTAPTFRAFVREPFELAIGQPHQMLISTASVAIVAAEAAAIVPYPANIALAVGAEWAYLRGLITGAGVKTRWAAALNWAAAILVFGYGGLWSLHTSGVIPENPAVWLAVLLTIVHIGAIGAVSICSAMLHRVSMDAKATEEHAAQAREDAQAEEDRRYQAELKRQRDQQQLDLEAEWKRAQLQIEAQRAQAAIDAERERTRAELRASVRAQRTNNASGTAANTPPNSPANTDREQLRAQVVRTLREQPQANRTQLARSLGIGRTTLYELIAEAKRAGELE